MVQAFSCEICCKPVTPGVQASACRHTCGCADCQRVYQRKQSQKYEAARRKRKIAKLKAQGIDPVVCAVCGEEFQVIHPLHLRKHGLSVAEYKERYLNAPILNSAIHRSRGRGSLVQSRYLTYDGQEPDRKLMEFLIGCLLGDGSLEKQSGKRNARYAEGGNNRAYLNWKYEFLRQYFPCTFDERLSQPDKRTGKQYRGWWIKSTVHPFLTKLHSRWYRQTKIIPRDLIEEYLTPFAFTVWFCDDGCSSSSVYLYTMNFDIREVEFLIKLLKAKFDLDFSIQISKHGQPLMRLHERSRDQLRGIIKNQNLPGMSYKLIL
jgi:hypothetical protein